jgi:UPF0755 protein
MSKYNRRPNFNTSKSFKIIPLLFFVAIFAFFGIWTKSSFFDSGSRSGQFSLEVKAGDNLASVGDNLASARVINNSLSLPIHSQFQEKWILLPGNYSLNLPANPTSVLTQLKQQSQAIEKTAKKGSVKLTFKEGDTVDDIITKVEKAGIVNSQEMSKIAQSKVGFEQFSFLPPKLDCEYGNINQCAKYYLEGYLYPDTYEFALPTNATEIYTKMLKNFEKKVWSKIPNKPNPSNFYNIVNMASVIERETGRPIEGVNDNNREEFIKEKKLMAGVFFNRLENKMKWQSDPTVTYGTGKSLCQQTLKSQNNCLYLNSPEMATGYNTYSRLGYPIGPTTSPTWDSIQAVIEPIENDFLFFVSDATGRKYFANTNLQHENNIAKVNIINSKLNK